MSSTSTSRWVAWGARSGVAVRRTVRISPPAGSSCSTRRTSRAVTTPSRNERTACASAAGISSTNGRRAAGSVGSRAAPSRLALITFRSASSTKSPRGRVSSTTSTNRFCSSSSWVRASTIASSRSEYVRTELNRRACSSAIAAWSAKADTRDSSSAVKWCTSVRRTVRAPMAWSPTMRGAASMERRLDWGYRTRGSP